MSKDVAESVLTPDDIELLENNSTQLTAMQKTFLQNIIDAKIIAISDVVLLERVAKELRATLTDHPPNPHGR